LSPEAGMSAPIPRTSTLPSGSRRGATRIRLFGGVGSALQLALAALLGVSASGPASFPNPPESIPRGLALGVLYALPAIVGALGALGERRSVLAAAAVMSTIGSVLAFSGVTLVFLAPALIFAAAAGAVAATNVRPRRPVWLTALVLGVGVPLVVLAATRIGIFILPALGLLLIGLEAGRGAWSSPATTSSQLLGVGLAAGIVVCGIGAGWVLLATTETRCWEAEQTPDGIVYRVVPDPGESQLPTTPNAFAAGCNSGVITPRGAILATVLGGASVVLAAIGAYRPVFGKPADGVR
jgi:hypothetical protein